MDDINQKELTQAMIAQAVTALKSWESFCENGNPSRRSRVLKSAKEQLLWILSDVDEYGSFRQACLWQDITDHRKMRQNILGHIEPKALVILFIEVHEEIDRLLYEASVAIVGEIEALSQRSPQKKKPLDNQRELF